MLGTPPSLQAEDRAGAALLTRKDHTQLTAARSLALPGPTHHNAALWNLLLCSFCSAANTRSETYH